MSHDLQNTYLRNTFENAMESGKVIAEGHVQLPAITPGETGKAASLFLLLSGKVMYWS